MGNLLKFSALVTKVKAMEGKLLKPAQYQQLITMRSVVELFSFLKADAAYSHSLGAINENAVHRGDIEKLLIQSLYHDYAKLYSFSGLEERKYLKLYLHHLEVDLINYCLRIISNHYQEPFDLGYKKDFFDCYSEISVDKLTSSGSIGQLVENLQGSIYYQPLSAIRDKEHTTLFDYDLTLNLFCYSYVWQQRHKVLTTKEKNNFIKEWGTKIDLLNLQWIYRAKKYFLMSPEHIYTIIIPIHYRLPKEIFKALVEASSIDEYFKILATTSYQKHYQEKASEPFDQMYYEALAYLFRVNQRQNPYSIAAVNNYLFKKEAEINRIITILECIRYDLSPSERAAYANLTVSERASYTSG